MIKRRGRLKKTLLSFLIGRRQQLFVGIRSLTLASLKNLSTRLKQKQAEVQDGAPSILSFDKDDEDTLDFVAASANLRSLIFGIETKSKFDIKRG